MRITCNNELHQSGGSGRFYSGRAEDLLPRLLPEYEGKVQLIYLDPPFGTGDTFYVKLKSGVTRFRLPAFSDSLDPASYVAWIRPILEGARRLLSPSGSLYLHVDHRMSARLRLLLDEIFGERNFMNEIVWTYQSGGRSTRYFPRKHDVILFYRKSAKVYFNIKAVGTPRGAEKRNHMKRFIDENGRVCFSIRSGGKLYVYSEDSLVYPSDVWTDIGHLQQKDSERVGYATQKPEALLRRIILASSKEGDLVCDLFSGSGTTASAAMRLHRNYLAVDVSPLSLLTLRARMLKNASTLSLLGDSHEMRLFYPTDEEFSPARFRCSLQAKRARKLLRVTEASFDDAYPLVYAALGTLAGETFHVLQADCRARLPLTFDITGLDAPVIQFCNAAGRHAFFTVLDEVE